jgi:hypothetical protein
MKHLALEATCGTSQRMQVDSLPGAWKMANGLLVCLPACGHLTAWKSVNKAYHFVALRPHACRRISALIPTTVAPAATTAQPLPTLYPQPATWGPAASQRVNQDISTATATMQMAARYGLSVLGGGGCCCLLLLGAACKYHHKAIAVCLDGMCATQCWQLLCSCCRKRPSLWDH